MSKPFVLVHPDAWGDRVYEGDSNGHLNRAIAVKDDEFYTSRWDVATEIAFYGRPAFKNKVVYCNCDTAESEIFRYLNERDRLGLKGLWLHPGPFGGKESIALLRAADIVVTNPPFSHFRAFVSQLIEYRKEFLIVGTIMAAGTKVLFPLIQRGEARVGYTRLTKFRRPDGSDVELGNCVWFTTLPVERQPLRLTAKFCEMAYPRYDNYDAVEVSRTSEIPDDYDGVMGVPLSFLEKHHPPQFEIVGQTVSWDGFAPGENPAYLRGKQMPRRVLIRHR